MRAYVVKSFPDQSTASAVQRKSHPIIRNEATFALGIILIKLSEGRPLESFQVAQDLDINGNRTFMTNYLIATRFLKPVYEREGTRYGDALRRCVYCEFDEKDPDLVNESFQTKVFEGVVSPLESNWDDFSRV